MGTSPRGRDPSGDAAADGADRSASHREVPRHWTAEQLAGIPESIQLQAGRCDGAGGTLRSVVIAAELHFVGDDLLANNSADRLPTSFVALRYCSMRSW